MRLCCSGPIDLSPIDSCRMGVSLEGSAPSALFSDPELPVIFSATVQGQAGSKSSMYTGTNPSCKDVPGRMGDKAYSCTSCSGLSGGGGVFKSKSQSSLTSSVSSTLSGFGEYAVPKLGICPILRLGKPNLEFQVWVPILRLGKPNLESAMLPNLKIGQLHNLKIGLPKLGILND